MRRIQPALPWRRLAAVPAVALLCGALLWSRHGPAAHRQLNQNSKHGRFTAAQIITRSGPICRALLPGAKALWLTAEPDTLPGPHGGARHWWTVECTDGTGAALAHLTWMGDTGGLCVVSCESLRPLPAARAPGLTRQAAIRCAWQWLQTLGLAGPWRLSSTAEGKQAWWLVRMRAPAQSATLSLNAANGRLIAAYIEPTRDSSANLSRE